MINFESLAPIFKQRILIITREYSLFERNLKKQYEVVVELTNLLLEKAEEIKFVTERRDIKATDKYIDLERIAKEMEVLSAKRDVVCAECNDSNRKMDHKIKILCDTLIENTSYKKDEILLLLENKINK